MRKARFTEDGRDDPRGGSRASVGGWQVGTEQTIYTWRKRFGGFQANVWSG